MHQFVGLSFEVAFVSSLVVIPHYREDEQLIADNWTLVEALLNETTVNVDSFMAKPVLTLPPVHIWNLVNSLYDLVLSLVMHH